jgi:LacI family transcriptional regulator
MLIGVLLPHFTRHFFFHVLKGIQVNLEEMGHNLMVFNLGNRPKRTYERILSANLDGLLVVSQRLPDHFQTTLDRYRIPVAYIDQEVESQAWTCIDNKEGGRLVGEYFVQKGIRKAAYIGESTETEQQNLRRDGFQQVFEEKGLPRPLEFYTKQDAESALKLTKMIWQTHKPEGLFYFCDEMAYGGLSHFKKSGEKPIIVGYDDLLPSKYLGLTTVRQPSMEMGSLGAEILFSLLNRELVHNRTIKPSLVVRES